MLEKAPSRGPLSGLTIVLAAIRTSHALVLAMDLPLMRSNILRDLWNQCDENCGVVPMNGNCYEPLCAIYPSNAANVVGASLSGVNYSLHNVVELVIAASSIKTRPIEVGDQRNFFNLNTPAEFSAFKFRQAGIRQSA